MVVINFTTLNCQSLYSTIRILLETIDTEIISVRGYDHETENQVQHLFKKK